MKYRSKYAWPIWLISLSLTLGACSGAKNLAPTTLRIAVLPDQSSELLHQQHDPLVEYLGKTLNIQTELVIPANYSELLKLFKERKVELAYFGGLTFVQSARTAQATPIAMRDIDLRFTTTFVASSKRSEKSLEEFIGKKISFGSKQSTSGHLMPRYYLEQRGVIPEKAFSEVSYSGAHDKTMAMVMTGESDLGAVNTFILDSLIEKLHYSKADFKIVWVTPPYPDYTWAVHENLNEDFKVKLQRAFLSLDPQNAEHSLVLQRQSAGGFLPVNVAEFDKLATIVKQLGIYVE